MNSVIKQGKLSMEKEILLENESGELVLFKYKQEDTHENFDFQSREIDG